MALEESLAQLRRQIKTWEHEFMHAHGRAPAKDDIKKNPKFSRLYKAYRALKAKAADKKSPAEAQDNKADERAPENGQKTEKDEKDENENSDDDFVVTANTELGPTPQANGKVLSIFDLQLMQPEQSPLRRKSAASPRTDGPSPNFKTPTKPKVIQPVTPVHSTQKGFMSKIAAAMESPSVSETPQYLKKNISKFDFSRSAGSPSSSPIKAVAPATPSRAAPVDFQVSPSPFKLHRHSSGHLVEVFQAHRSLQLTEAEIGEFGGGESSDEDVTASPTRKKARTQKRTTRRWKMKPNIVAPDNDLDKKDLHQEIEKIDQQASKHIQNYLEDVSGSDSEEAPKPTASTGRKIAPISHNYKRLKINNKSKFKKFRRR